MSKRITTDERAEAARINRALKDLLHLQSPLNPPVTNSQNPKIKNAETNPSPTQPSTDQQSAPPAMAHFLTARPPLLSPPKPPLHRHAAASIFLAAIFSLMLFSARALALARRVEGHGVRKFKPVPIFLGLALAVQFLGEDDGFSQLLHRTAETAAFTAQAEIGVFLGEVVAALQDALGALDDFAGFQFALETLVFAGEAGALDGDAHLLSNESEQGDLLGAVLVRLAMVDVDDTDDITAADERDGEKRFVGVFDQAREAFESLVGGGAGGERDDGLVLDHPASDTFADFQSEIAELGGVRDLRGHEDHLAGLLFEKVDQAGVTAGDLRGHADHFSEHFLERAQGADNAADAM